MSRKCVAVALAIAMVGAICVGDATAAPTTEARKWFAGATETGTTELTSPLKALAMIGENPTLGKKFLLKSELGSPPVPIEKTATGIECVGCVLENKEVTGKVGRVAFGTGKVKLTGVTIMTPANCEVEGGALTSKTANIHADLMIGTKHYVQFIPASGTAFASFEIVGTKCGIAGLYTITGTLFAEIKNATGVCSKELTANFSPAINASAEGSLQIGSKPVFITGTAVIKTEGEKFFCVK